MQKKKRQPRPGKKLAEGKSKIVVLGRQPGTVKIASKDIVSFNNGKTKVRLRGSGSRATRIAASIFRGLNRRNIVTHFVSKPRRGVKANEFIAERLWMIPVEVVVRRLAAGSLLLRKPRYKLGQSLGTLLVEFYAKDDKLGDPLMIIDPVSEQVLYYDQLKVLAKGFIKEHSFRGPCSQDDLTRWFIYQRLLSEGITIAKNVFAAISMHLQQYQIILVDLKLEFGLGQGKDRARLVVGDLICNECWRIWKGGDPKKALDKHLLLDGKGFSPTALRKFRRTSIQVEQIMRKF
jgi:phosphoribosylaminoimidazole-succinocarboxamide synthase